jgi:hypothetical protein
VSGPQRSEPSGLRVNLLDRITIRFDELDSWLERWRRDYLPDAQRRGMRMVGRWRAFADDEAVTIHVLWEIEGVHEFYAMRRGARTEPAVAEFWAWTDERAVSRERCVLEPMGELS